MLARSGLVRDFRKKRRRQDLAHRLPGHLAQPLGNVHETHRRGIEERTNDERGPVLAEFPQDPHGVDPRRKAPSAGFGARQIRWMKRQLAKAAASPQFPKGHANKGQARDRIGGEPDHEKERQPPVEDQGQRAADHLDAGRNHVAHRHQIETLKQT